MGNVDRVMRHRIRNHDALSGGQADITDFSQRVFQADLLLANGEHVKAVTYIRPQVFKTHAQFVQGRDQVVFLKVPGVCDKVAGGKEAAVQVYPWASLLQQLEGQVADIDVFNAEGGSQLGKPLFPLSPDRFLFYRDLVCQLIDLHAGVFQVDSTGKLQIDFLADSGAYRSEMAVFSLVH